MKYKLKTRNWNGSLWVKKVLDVSLNWGMQSTEDYGDHDVKYYGETNSLIKGLLIIAWYKLLSPFSGGWTYIYNNDKNLSMANYRTLYI